MISNIQVKGMDKVLQGMSNLGKELSNPKQPLENSGSYMQQEALKNFPAKGSVMQEGGWPQLAKPEWRTSAKGKRYWFPGTQAIKKAKGYGGQPMMVRTGDLRDSFKKSEPRIGANISSIDVLNPVSYAIEHQLGIGKNLPRRTLLKFRANHRKKITDIFIEWIVKSTQKSFK